MKAKKAYLLFIVLVMVLVSVAFHLKADEGRKTGLQTQVIEVDEGYGYQILYDNKVLVKQEFIPAIQGKRPFKSMEEAQLIGDVVMEKLKKGDDPFITVSELRHMQITF
ncbi:protein of unknown function [Zobellia uliginosa]|uniref:DUF4907 domain-containing protein n=1 Tax=Zobellia uliginosa TaxID=143224 RepID=A0ABY1KZD3_9FLAO|nr:DUF4907 domain-containing protein [Zobellia uliginosa]SIS84512.1 protein of unknown function [Zobellia uliginosa]